MRFLAGGVALKKPCAQAMGRRVVTLAVVGSDTK